MDDNKDKNIDILQIHSLDEILDKKSDLKIQTKLPNDEFNDIEQKKDYIPFSGLSGASKPNIKLERKYGYSFNMDDFESNSIAYFNEILLGNKRSNCFHVQFDFNHILKIDKIIVDYCRLFLNKEFELIGDIDGIITNVQKEEIIKAKNENSYSIFSSKNFFKENNTYDIFCESTFGFIEKFKSEKFDYTLEIKQLKKIIYLIKDVVYKINIDIDNNSDIYLKILKAKINSLFHHNPNNKIILAIICDGNYRNLIEQIKNFCLFSKDWKDNYDKNEMKGLYEYFKILRESEIPFLIVYCPRFNERNSKYFNPISKIYYEDKNSKEKMTIQTLKIENENLRQQFKLQNKNIEEQDKKIKEHDKKLKILETKIDDLSNQLKKSNNEKENNLIGKKRGRCGKNFKSKMKKRKEKNTKNDYKYNRNNNEEKKK